MWTIEQYMNSYKQKIVTWTVLKQKIMMVLVLVYLYAGVKLYVLEFDFVI